MSAEFGTSVDLREVSPGSRIAVAIYTSCLLRRGEAMEVIADHDPVDLLTEFQHQPDRFGCEYLERGPTVWRIRVVRTRSPACPTACCSTNCWVGAWPVLAATAPAWLCWPSTSMASRR